MRRDGVGSLKNSSIAPHGFSYAVFRVIGEAGSLSEICGSN